MSETTLVDLMILNRSFKVKVETQHVTLVKQRMQDIQTKLVSLKNETLFEELKKLNEQLD
jgi:hypothetical protein